MPDASGEFIIHQPEKPTSDNVPEKPQEKNAHFFSNLALYPGNISFEDQEENEEITLLIRHDLITNTGWIVAATILILIPPIIQATSAFFTPFFTISGVTQIILVLFYYLLVFGFILVQFTLWYFNAVLVTSIRIIDYDVTGILVKHISETKLNLVEDVNYSQVGSVRTIFDYGDVTVQTAGASENFIFELVPQPARIVKIIGDMIGGQR